MKININLSIYLSKKINEDLSLSQRFEITRTVKKETTVIFKSVKLDNIQAAKEAFKTLQIQNDAFTQANRLTGELPIEVLFTKNTSQGHLKDIVARVKPELFNALMKVTTIGLGFQMIRVEKFTAIHVCFKCNGYGHHTKDCRNVLSCPHCAQEHKYSECPNRDMSKICCANCKRTNDKAFEKDLNEASVGGQDVNMEVSSASGSGLTTSVFSILLLCANI